MSAGATQLDRGCRVLEADVPGLREGPVFPLLSNLLQLCLKGVRLPASRW